MKKNDDERIRIGECTQNRRTALYDTLDLFPSVSAHTPSNRPQTRILQTSKNRFRYHTWNSPFPPTTPSWKMLHHFTREFVLSAVFRWTISRTTMYLAHTF
jgi:hypothetical protein